MSEILFESKENGINEIIVDSGKGRSFIALKEVRWSADGEFKLDIRRWYAKSQDTEEMLIPGKGVTIGDEGAHRLSEVLVANGYGNIEKLIDGLAERDDIPDELSKGIDVYRIRKLEEQQEVFDPDGLFK